MGNDINIVTNNEGAITEPYLHDGYLKKIEIIGDKKIALGITSVKGHKYEFLLEGIAAFRANEFLEGNIIFEIIIKKNPIEKVELLQKLYNMDSKNQYYDKTLNDVKTKNLILIQINPSYGCELLALCKYIKMSET